MDILLDAQLESPAVPPAFYLTLDPEAMSLQCIGDMAAITVQAFMTRRPAFWNKPRFQGLDPVLFALQGVLYGTSNQAIGATLVPGDTFPLEFPDENYQLLNLAFHCSRSYLQLVEEQRASTPTANLTLGFSFWTAMNLVPSPQKDENTIPVQSSYQGKMIHIKSRQGQSINISRSHWSDMLSSIEYPQKRYIELPTLKPQEGAEEIHKAIERLNQAYTLFAQERYREAVQLCRQVRDVLLGEDKPTWAERVLTPIILDKKAAMVDEGIKALNNLGHEASHGAGIEIDRETANYVIGSLTLILDYIGRKLR
jgi:hypothetical protein